MREKSFYDDVAIKNESKASTNTILKLLKPYVSDFIKPIIIASFMLAIAAGMVIGFGKFLSFAVNNGLLSKGSDYFGWILIGLGTSVILLALASYARTYYISWIGEQMMARLRYDLFNHTLKFPLSFFEDYQPANLVTRLTSDMNLLQLVLTNSLGIFI
jgi:ATP-binding cassette subfamily B protein